MDIDESSPSLGYARFRKILSKIFTKPNFWLLGAVFSKLFVYATIVATENNLSKNWLRIQPPKKSIIVEIFSHQSALIGLGTYAGVLYVCARKWGPLEFKVPRYLKVVVETAMINVSMLLAAIFDDGWSLVILFGAIFHLICLSQLAVVVDSIGLYDNLLSAFGSGIFTQADKHFSKSVAISISSVFTLLIGSLKHFHQFKRELSDGNKVQNVFTAVKIPVDNALGAAKGCAKACSKAADLAEKVVEVAGTSNELSLEVKNLAASSALEEVRLAESAMIAAASAKSVVKFAKYIVNAPQPSTEEGVLSLEIQKVLLDGAMAESDLLAEEVLTLAATCKENHESLIELAGKASEAAGRTLEKAMDTAEATQIAKAAAESSDMCSRIAAEAGKKQQPKRPGLRQRSFSREEV